MSPDKRYPAKVMLFGEYSILIGSSALSTPFSRYYASLRAPDKKRNDLTLGQVESNLELSRFYGYLGNDANYFGSHLDIEQFGREIAAGLYLHSTIPRNYGLGSSGALCAAIYGRYGIHDLRPAIKDPVSGFWNPDSGLQSLFSRMESYFHGRSSGYDPLVSYIQKTILLNPGQPVQEIDIPSLITKRFPVSLIDSGLPSRTGSLVSGFLATHTPGGVADPAAKRYMNLTNLCVLHYLNAESGAFINSLRDLSMLQFEYFRHLIPPSLHLRWEEGLNSGSEIMKLCGSGGGGFFLCFSQNGMTSLSHSSMIVQPNTQ